MIAITITWVFMFALLLSLGAGTFVFYLRLLGNNYNVYPNIFQLAWLGYAVIICILQVCSILLPVNTVTVAGIIFLAFVSYLSSHDHVKQSLKYYIELTLFHKIIFITGIAVIIIYQSYNTSFVPLHYDTYLYHLNAVKWAKNYPAVPGIANLHGRLAFNSSFHLFAALTDRWIWEDRAVYIANSFLLFLISVQWLDHIVNMQFRSPRLESSFAIITAPFLIATSIGWNIPSLSTDIPFFIVSLAVIFELISISSTLGEKPWNASINEGNLFSWSLAVLLTAVAFSTKLAGAPLCIILYPVALYLLVSFSHRSYGKYLVFRHFAVMNALAVIIFAGLVLRYIILSGWLIYPVPIGNLHLDWSVKREEVVDTLNWVKSWARMPGARPEEVLGNGISYWIIPWLSRFRQNYPALLLLFCGVVGSLCTVCFKSVKDRKAPLSCPYYLAIAIGITGLIYWFLTAPDFRFGEVFFWIFAGTALAPLFFLLVNFHPRMRIVASFLIILSLCVFKYVRGDLLTSIPSTMLPRLLEIPPAAAPRDYLVPVVVENGQTPPLIVFKPANGDQCGNSPLPCSPSVNKDSPIELRVPGDLRSGFRTTDARSADMHR